MRFAFSIAVIRAPVLAAAMLFTGLFSLPTADAGPVEPAGNGDPRRDADADVLDAFERHYPAVSPDEVEWEGESAAGMPEPDFVNPTGSEGMTTSDICWTGVDAGDAKPRYRLAFNQTASESSIEVSTGCPEDVVQEVRGFVSIAHPPAGYGSVENTQGRDSGYPVAFADTRQTVAWYTPNSVLSPYYGPGTQLKYCFVWGYVDSDANLHWMNNVARVRTGVGNWS